MKQAPELKYFIIGVITLGLSMLGLITIMFISQG